MAVIREERQFKIGPIGVARASEGGQVLGQTIANVAQDIGNTLYKRAAEDAEKAGLDYAKAVAVDQIRGIDPHTGAPVALNNMKEMGRIQAQAYERIIQQRFEASIEEEIRLKSSEYAMKYEDPNTFQQVMGNHISEMAKNATGQYGTYINEVGSIWTSRASLALQENAIRKAKAAAAEAAKERKKREAAIAFSLGGASAQGDTQADRDFEKLTGTGSRLDRDVRAFTGGGGADAGRAAPQFVEPVSSNAEANESFALGYALAALPSLTNADRNALKASLQFGVAMPMSKQAANVYSRVAKLVQNPLKLSKFGADLNTEVSYLNTNFPNMMGDFSTRYTSATNILAADVESNVFLNSGHENLAKNFELLNIVGTSAEDADVVGADAFSRRNKELEAAQRQAASGSILSILDAASPSAEDLKAVHNGLVGGSAAPLYALAESAGIPLSEETKSALNQLLSVIDKPDRALEVISSMDTYMVGAAEREKKRHDTFIDQNLDMLINKVAINGATADTIAEEYGALMSKSDKYPEVIQRLKDAQNISVLREAVTGLDIYGDPDAMKEIRLLAGGGDVNTPILDSLGYTKDIKAILRGITSPTLRAQAVASLQETAPNISAQEEKARKAAVEKYRRDIDTSQFDNQSVNMVQIFRDEMSKTIGADPLLNQSDKEEIIAHLHKEAGKAIASTIISEKVDITRLDQASAYITSGGKQKGDLTEREQKELDKVVGTFATEADREAIAANVSIKAGKRREAEAEQRENNKISAAMSVWNGESEGIIGFDAAGDIMTGLERKYGVAVPPDAMTNPQKYLAAAGDTGSADYKAGLLVKEMLDKSNRIMLPPVRDYFRNAAGGRFDAQQLENVGMLWAYSGMDAMVRSQSAVASGLDLQEIGILEGLAEQVSSGVPTTYLDEVVAGLRQPRTTEDAFVNRYGSARLDSLNAYIKDVLPAEVGTDAALLRFYGNYALGLSLTNVSPSRMRETLQSHFENAFYADPLTSNIAAPAFGKVHTGVLRAFGNDTPRVNAAVQLWHVDQWAQIGSKYKDLPLRDQILKGKSEFEQSFKRIYVSGNLSNMPMAITQQSLVNEDADLGGKLTYTFVARSGTQNHNAKFDAFTLNQNGQLGAAPFVSGLNPLDTRVHRFADELKREPLTAGTFDDRAIDFWIRNRK